MDHLSRIGVFTEVVKQQSFAGAARVLGITSSAVSKHIQNLEHSLQVKLLNRTTRKVWVTEEGAVFFERASRALDDLKEAESQINDMKACPQGPLKISIPNSFGAKYLVEPIANFARLYPNVEMDIHMDDRMVDIVGDNYDAVVRIGLLDDSTLIARKLADCPLVLCASPGYLNQHGTLKTPEDLSKHNVIAYTRNDARHHWQYKDKNGNKGQIRLNGTFKSDSGAMELEAAHQGIGLVILPIFYVSASLQNGRLVPLLEDYQTYPARNIHVVFPQNRYLSTRLRLFVDHLTTICDDLPW